MGGLRDADPLELENKWRDIEEKEDEPEDLLQNLMPKGKLLLKFFTSSTSSTCI